MISSTLTLKPIEARGSIRRRYQLYKVMATGWDDVRQCKTVAIKVEVALFRDFATALCYIQQEFPSAILMKED